MGRSVRRPPRHSSRLFAPARARSGTPVAFISAITLYQDIQKKSKLAADQGTIAAVRSAGAIYYGKNNGIFPSKGQLDTLVIPSPPVFQCTGGTYTADSNNGKVVYSPNDIASC